MYTVNNALLCTRVLAAQRGKRENYEEIDQSNSVDCKQCTVVYGTRVLAAQRGGKEKISGNRSIKQCKECTVMDRQRFVAEPNPHPDPTLYQPGQVNN